MSAVFSVRRIVWLAALAALSAAMLAWLRERNETPTPAAPPQWPPLRAVPDPAPPSDRPARVADATDTTGPVTNTDSHSWQAPNADGSCPIGFPVKVKDSSGIYHLPEGSFYTRTNADRCYLDAAAAEADGYRRAKS